MEQGRTDRVIMTCRKCKIYGLRLRLRMRGRDPIIWQVSTGIALRPYLCCMYHEDMLIAKGGWDGSGNRQNKEARV